MKEEANAGRVDRRASSLTSDTGQETQTATTLPASAREEDEGVVGQGRLLGTGAPGDHMSAQMDSVGT